MRPRIFTAPQQISAAIKEQILERALKPGDPLPSELDLAGLFGVSRPTVRNALRELVTAGILQVKRGRQGGYRVADLSLDHLEADVAERLSLSLVVDILTFQHLWEVRQAVELLAAEIAAKRRTPEALRRLEEVIPPDGMPTDSRRAVELDLDFHRRLAECTANPLLVSIESATIAVFVRFWSDVNTASPEIVLGDLPSVIAAVRVQDAVAAREAMERHLGHSRRYLGIVSDGAAADQPRRGNPELSRLGLRS